MLRRNLLANFVGQGLSALMALAFIPVYIRYLGMESYGLIGVFTLLQTGLVLLDMGMTPALNREMARFTGGARDAQSVVDLLRSIETVALAVAVAFAVVIWAASRWLAIDWVKPQSLSPDTVAQAFALMGVVVAFRFIEGIYRSALVGLQRQVLFNAINVAMAALRSIGVIPVMAWASATIEAFFLWQGLVSLVAVATLAAVTYGILPTSDRAGRFSLAALSDIRRFAGGMLGITVLVLLLTQVDKILLSRLLTLGDYGYYTLAASVAGGLAVVAGPIGQAYFPRLSQLHAQDDQTALIRAYHQGSQLVSVVVGSAAAMLVVFSERILRLWTQNAELASGSWKLLSILAFGTMLNCLMWMPYQTQLAHAWTSLTMRTNIVAVFLVVPAILWATPRFGAEGAAFVWVALNAGYVLVGVHFMYLRILKKEKWRWYVDDVLRPLAAAYLVVGLSAWLTPRQSSPLAQVSVLAITFVLALLTAALAIRPLRHGLLSKARTYCTRMREC